MKKIITIILALIMTLTICACSGVDFVNENVDKVDTESGQNVIADASETYTSIAEATAAVTEGITEDQENTETPTQSTVDVYTISEAGNYYFTGALTSAITVNKDAGDVYLLKGIFNRGKKFARNTVYNILKNEKYSGIYRHNDEIFDNIYPQIVPTEIYEKVRRKIDANKYGKHSVEVVYLLRNKIKCGYCGSPISAECGTAKNGEKIRYYKCLGRKHQNGCKKSQVRKEILEKYVLDNVIEQLSKPEIQNYIADRLMAVQERKIKENSALNALTKEIRQTENSINNIMEAIEEGGTSATAMKRLRELETKLEDLQKQITIEKARSVFRLSKAEIIQFYKAGLEKEPIKLINHLIKEILLYDDKMIIFYNTPKTIDLDESQGFSFYDRNIKMPYVIQNKKNYGMQDFRLVMEV